MSLKLLSTIAPPALALAALLGAPAMAASLAERVETCGACHGEDGNARLPGLPSLAGQPNFYLMNQLILIREGVRKIPEMEALAKELKDEDILELAAHYAAAPSRRSEETPDPALVARGAQVAASHHCASCHTPALTGQEQMPRLAGQRIDYMVASLKAMRDNRRTSADPLMVETVVGLSDQDLAALANYAASK